MAPLILILLAVGASVLVAYGTDSGIARWSHGLELIMWSRRLQWPLIALALILCIAMIALVISGKRRAWWLIGLAPVLALFAHRFATGPAALYATVEDPSYVAADASRSFLADEDWVVGLMFEGEAYAFPYTALYHTPVVLQSEHDQHIALFWSPSGNRAMAFNVSRELKSRDLDVVSMPGNALLIYNTRLGEFINGLTGLTPTGQTPQGLKDRVPTTCTAWSVWRALHPQTHVMLPTTRIDNAPHQPVMPVPLNASFLSKPASTQPTSQPATQPSGESFAAPVVFLGGTSPLAIPQELLIGSKSENVLNVSADGIPVLLFRDPQTQTLKAFDRRVEADLRPKFQRNTGKKHKGAAFVDVDTETGWSASGVALDGEHKGQRLVPVTVEENLYWGVMRYWYPSLTLYTPVTPPAN